MALTYRETKGSALTIAELDGNFQFFTGSHSITGSLIVTQAITASSLSGSFTGSFLGTSSYATQALSASYALNSGGSTNTGSLLTTASAANNIITFTKGDASTFNVTVATGSAVTVNTGSLMVTGSATNNVLTFTKGDGSTFALTVATGSGGGSTNTGSLLTTASAVGPVITFTKGDASTFSVTVATGSAVSASYAISSSYADQALSASYATRALSASYFSGSIGGATFTGDISFTSGSNVDGTLVIAPPSDVVGYITGGLQVLRQESGGTSNTWVALNCQGGSGRLIAVDKNNDNPNLFIMLHDLTNSASVMEFRTETGASGVDTAYIVMNTAFLPTLEPAISGQLWVSGSAGSNSKLLAVRN